MQIIDETSNLIYASFDSTGRRLNVGTKQGFRVLNIGGESFKEKYAADTDGGCSIIESYKGTILTVGNDDSAENSSRKLRIWSGNELKYEMMFITPIMNVRLNGSYIVVCLENEIFVYDMNLKQCRNYKTKLNAKAVIALSNNNHLAYPSSEYEFTIANLDDDHRKKFSTPVNIGSMQFSYKEDKIAIVDDSGKTIYIYNTKDEKQESIKLIRGHTHAQIYQPSFSPLGEIIGVASRNTAHFFEVQPSEGFLKKIWNSSAKKIKLKSIDSLLSFIHYNPDVKHSQERMFDKLLVAIVSSDGYLEKIMFNSGVEKKLGRYKIV